MDAFLGQIHLFPFEFVPRDWALCDGSGLDINKYDILYGLLGFRFGGGHDEGWFGLPDMRGVSPASENERLQYCICLSGPWPSDDSPPPSVTVGDIFLFPYEERVRRMKDWHPCDGSLLRISDYNMLYSLIGDNFGGSGDYFALPNLPNPVPEVCYTIVARGIYPTLD